MTHRRDDRDKTAVIAGAAGGLGSALAPKWYERLMLGRVGAEFDLSSRSKG